MLALGCTLSIACRTLQPFPHPPCARLCRQSHGTHVAGIAAALGGNGVGVAGLAWQAPLLVCRIFNKTSDGAFISSITRCTDLCLAVSAESCCCCHRRRTLATRSRSRSRFCSRSLAASPTPPYRARHCTGGSQGHQHAHGCCRCCMLTHPRAVHAVLRCAGGSQGHQHVPWRRLLRLVCLHGSLDSTSGSAAGGRSRQR